VRTFARTRALADRVVQAFEQLRAIGQAGQRVVPRLVRQALLGTHAFADLRAQFAIGAGEFLGARLDAELEFRMRGLQVLLRALALPGRRRCGGRRRSAAPGRGA
jgi:hypothetical protein